MANQDDPPVIQPPASATVDLERKPVLYLPNGKALFRQIGFKVPEKVKEK